MKVAAYQAPLAACADAGVISLVRQQVDRCEALGVQLLCCPEALLGGLADYVDMPDRIALETGTDQLARTLAPLASDHVTTVIGFTERGSDGHLYNAAAVFARGAVVGIYRKMHPAINRSVYRAGVDAPRRRRSCILRIFRDREPGRTRAWHGLRAGCGSGDCGR